MWPSVHILDFQRMAHIPLSALSSPQIRLSLMVIQLLCNCFHWSIFSIHLQNISFALWKEANCTTSFVPRCPISALCPNLLLFLEVFLPLFFLTPDILIFTVMFSQVITFTFLYPMSSPPCFPSRFWPILSPSLVSFHLYSQLLFPLLPYSNIPRRMFPSMPISPIKLSNLYTTPKTTQPTRLWLASSLKIMKGSSWWQ